MALKLATAPASEPVSLSEAKLHCRVDVSADDALITALITAAREEIERASRHALITQTWDYYLDEWPDGDELELPVAPLQSVTSVQYTDDAAVTATLSSGAYVVDTASRPGRLKLKSGQSWPTVTLAALNGVVVRFVAGFGSSGSNVDQSLRQAMLLLIGHWYENREAIVSSGAVPKQVPFAVEALCRSYRMRVVRW